MEQKIQKAIASLKPPHSYGGVLGVSHAGQDNFAAYGNFQVDTPYFIASTTKLFVTTLILMAEEKGLLSRHDSISKYLDPKITQGLHVLKGVDSSAQLSIVDLMSHRSGLPDYFQQKIKGQEKGVMDQIFKGLDQTWDFEQVIQRSKAIPPRFYPRQGRKAFYSDTNYQILGKILENVFQQSFKDLVKEKIFLPLQMSSTYLYSDPQDKTPVDIYYKTQALHIPKAMSSFGPDGGVVSTAQDMMIFIKAFFKGELFAKEKIVALQDWCRIFYPLESGIGIHRFRLPRIFSPFSPIPEIIGHSGLSGAFAFYCPKKDLYMTGTVNQLAQPSLSFRLMVKLLT